MTYTTTRPRLWKRSKSSSPSTLYVPRYGNLNVSSDFALQCRYYGKYERDGIRGFIMEYCDGVNLFDKLVKDGKFSEKTVKKTMKYVFEPLRQLRHRPLTRFRFRVILGALAEIHGENIIHRDIK